MIRRISNSAFGWILLHCAGDLLICYCEIRMIFLWTLKGEFSKSKTSFNNVTVLDLYSIMHEKYYFAFIGYYFAGLTAARIYDMPVWYYCESEISATKQKMIFIVGRQI